MVTPSDSVPAFTFACPICNTPLAMIDTGEQRCPADGQVYRRIDGIWHMLRPGREAYFAQFVEEYETVRKAEGRGSDDPAYYRALPHSGALSKPRLGWAVRAKSYTTFIARLLRPMEHMSKEPLQILDLGAGNGWLSNRLAARAHRVVALDLMVNPFDGLRVHRHYESEFMPLRAEFDHLPLDDGQFDMLIFNAALHYSPDYQTTLHEGPAGAKAAGRAGHYGYPGLSRWREWRADGARARSAF